MILRMAMPPIVKKKIKKEFTHRFLKKFLTKQSANLGLFSHNHFSFHPWLFALILHFSSLVLLCIFRALESACQRLQLLYSSSVHLQLLHKWYISMDTNSTQNCFRLLFLYVFKLSDCDSFINDAILMIQTPLKIVSE